MFVRRYYEAENRLVRRHTDNDYAYRCVVFGSGCYLQRSDAMKRVAVVTASRADAGIYIPVIKALEKSSKVDYFLCSYETLTSKGDIVVVLGDTMPMLKATIWASERNIIVAHIHGGDTTGSIDNKIRYAITAFSDWHFPSLPEHALKLWEMGIPENRIKVVGPLGIYAMKDAEFISEGKLREDLGLSSKPIVIVLQHPVSTEVNQSEQQMKETLGAVISFDDIQPVVFYPNSENGSQDIIKVILGYPFKTFKNLPYLHFVSLLKYSAVIVGNSSSGLVEAPLFGVPCVNIGTRQWGRISGRNIYNSGYDSREIIQQIQNALHDGRELGKNPYALNIDGPSIIVKTLEKL